MILFSQMEHNSHSPSVGNETTPMNKSQTELPSKDSNTSAQPAGPSQSKK